MTELFKNFEKYGKKAALVDEMGNSYNYKHILSKANHINSLIKKKSIILIIASNSVDSIIGYVSFIKTNNISILLDKSFKIDFVKKIIKKYKPNYLFGPKNYFDQIKENSKIFSMNTYDLKKTNFPIYKKININNLLLLPTSGTTQSPKFVRLSKVNLFNNAKNIIKYLKINSSHTTITTMPMGYSYGLSIINSHLESGSKIVITSKTIFDREFWKKITKYQVNSSWSIFDISPTSWLIFMDSLLYGCRHIHGPSCNAHARSFTSGLGIRF